MLNLEIVGEGATTKIYRDKDKAIKLYVNAPPQEAENEARLQSFAIQAGLPVPAVAGVRKIDDTLTALEMAYIPGKPLMHEKMAKDERHNAINTLVRLQRMVHQVNAQGLPRQTDRLIRKIEHCPHLDNMIKNKLLALLHSLDTDAGNLCHGDFHPLNILIDGEKFWIIDWVDATAGNPLADACRTYVIFRQYLYRSAGIYLRSFCKASGYGEQAVLDWLPVVAAARLSENMDDKARSCLLKIVEEWAASCL